MKLVILGSAACIPHPDRANTCLWVRSELGYLIDCPGTAPFRLAQIGADFQEIDAILISHLHGDHTAGLGVLLKSMELLDRSKTLWLVGPAGLSGFLDQFMQLSFGEFHPNFELRSLELSWDRGTIPELSLDAARMDHSAPCYGFRIGSLCYSSDTRPCSNLVQLAKGAQILLHDSSVDSRLERIANLHGHSSAAQAGKMAAEAGVQKLVLIHIESSYRGRESLLIQDAARWFRGEILVASDLMELQI